VGLASLEVVLDRGGEDGWFASPSIVAFTLVAVVSLVAFMPWELTRKEPIVDLRLLANRQFAMCSVALVAVGVLIFSTIQLLPQLLQTVMHYSATSAGLAMSPGGMAALAELPFFLERVQPRVIIAFGMAIEAVALWPHDRLCHRHELCHHRLGARLSVARLAFLFVPLTTAAYSALPPDNQSGIGADERRAQPWRQHRHRGGAGDDRAGVAGP
jgi:DHA2 family multidrug resistance protein